MKISHLDHIVLTVADIKTTCQFYQSALNFEVITFGDNRKALQFGHQKINLHQIGEEFEPKAHQPTAGSADLCFIAETPLDEIIKHLRLLNVEIIEGPIERTGAIGKIISVYVRDPDQNLIEISNYL
ncbi:MAG TPA: VOC family virulence protein [Acinetobacter sp.]|uniref:VOC family protein n=1 Tax=Acinetobacter venetianus TaxID=52133 RepID=UPI000E8DDCEB|nr:VOC family protein [Acinetobacter venetianus]HBO71023.1 VOC family virulence protein [Acinetobacter sp.]